MGRATTQTPAAAPQPLKHFSHPHELHPIQPNQIHPTTSTLICSGCKLQLLSNGTMYACIPCNFTLHQSCAKLPQLITHPCHAGCNLTLLTVSSYPGGVFSCDACSQRGSGWSYHCTRCDYDLHVACACKPLKIKHRAHVSCELELTFKNPYVNTNGFSCDICRRIGSKQWLYRCHTCEFDVHLDCTTGVPPQPTLQHHHSFPVNYMQGQTVAPHLVHSASTGGIGNPNYGMTNNQFQGQGQVINGSGQVYQQMNMGRPMQNQQQQQQMNMQNQQQQQQQSLGNNLMMAAMQGFVEGAFQEVGQTVVQEVIAGCGDGGGGGDCGVDGY